MLSSWLNRGLGQIVAPDDNVTSREEDDEEGGFWSLVAPPAAATGGSAAKEEKKEGKETESSTTTRTTPISTSTEATTEGPTVRCVHCREWTPISTPVAAAVATTPVASDTTTSSRTPWKTPSPKHRKTLSSNPRALLQSPLDTRVLVAAQETAASFASPTAVAEPRQKVFRLVASPKPLNGKLQLRLKRTLHQDPFGMLQARSARLGSLVPDGYTPWMAAAYANHVVALQVLLEVATTTFSEAQEASSSSSSDTKLALEWFQHQVDLSGQTGLHIAAAKGCREVVDWMLQQYQECHLFEKMVGPSAPVDLMGHTPLAKAVLANHTTVGGTLFSPTDPSIVGTPAPLQARFYSTHPLQLVVGHADMPGHRVIMEDCVALHLYESSQKPLALVGVCDGHGDQGWVSEYCAANIGDLVYTKVSSNNNNDDEKELETALISACLELDDSLKSQNLKGGSTAVWACVWQDRVACVNVGDSRCILIQKTAQEEKEEEELQEEELQEEVTHAMETLKVEEETADTTETPTPPTTTTTRGYTVVPLSHDHKPHLPKEQERIEAAGLTVLEEAYTDEKTLEECTISKVQRSSTDRLAVSRAFGDFEYKQNTTLSREEQAVVAVPDIVVHKRNVQTDMYLVLACDGVWDVMSNEDVADFVVNKVEEVLGETKDNHNTRSVLPHVGDLLLQECLDRGSTDNMSVVLVALSQAAERLGLPVLLQGKALDYDES